MAAGHGRCTVLSIQLERDARSFIECHSTDQTGGWILRGTFTEGQDAVHMQSTSTIRLDRDALEENLQIIRRIAGPGVGLCVVVKADAYGIGANKVVPRMVEHGVDLIAVYSPMEAAQIGEYSGSTPILVLMPVREIDRGSATVGLLARNRLHLVAHDEAQVECLQREAEIFGNQLHLHLELDTGMGRGGCDTEEGARVLARIAADPRLTLAGVMTHLPDPFGDSDGARKQGSKLRAFLRANASLVPENCRIHAAATAAALCDGTMQLDMIRVGLAWTGVTDHLSVPGSVHKNGQETLRPILSWWSDLVHVRNLPEGSPVGYGSRWRARRDSVIGLVPVGYAHGYPEALAGRKHRVILHGRGGSRTVPVIGAVNMDQLTIDLTDVGTVGVGDAVELISNDPDSPAHLGRVAQRTGRTPYALLAGLDSRVQRVMVAGQAHQVTTSVAVAQDPGRLASGG